MDIVRVVGVALVGAICVVVLKNSQSSFAMLASIATGIVVLIISLNSLGDVILTFQEIVDRTGIDNALFACLLKIVGVGYLTEFAVSICNDFECASIGKKLAFAGKIAIFLMAVPIVKALIELVAKLV